MANNKPTRICSIDGCVKKHEARGWCEMHYARWKRHGDPLTVHVHYSPQSALAGRLEPSGDCLIWTGGTTPDGYGRIKVGGRGKRVHRFVWEQTNGPILPGLQIDHTCHVRLCCNIEHLRLATNAENSRNLSGPRSNNLSNQIRNVYPHGRGWKVEVARNGKSHYFGTFDTIEEATKVAARARKELFGEFAGKG